MAGQLVASDAYPTTGKNKTCYFVKKDVGVIPLVKDDLSFKRNLIYGDLSHQPLENLGAFIENVCIYGSEKLNNYQKVMQMWNYRYLLTPTTRFSEDLCIVLLSRRYSSAYDIHIYSEVSSC